MLCDKCVERRLRKVGLEVERYTYYSTICKKWLHKIRITGLTTIRKKRKYKVCNGEVIECGI
jgi:hypothetical protein